ncbi:TonB-dependent receptor domain-containing protein [Hymenobacter sp. B81]|uniref:TonB-dependent receptor domain-containing protein n=1 Tax=Hymenobacter sp. B81 TaxID=3344878 RepID=UPI0037DC72D0
MLFTTPLRPQLGAGLLVACLSLPAAAQTAGSVSGTLLDHATRQPLPFASVVLLRAQDSTLVTGAQTSEAGAFRLEKVPPGNYLLRATVLGYQPLRRRLSVAESQPLGLGNVALMPATTQLKGVTVTGEKAPVVDNLDKRVINVAKDLTSVGGTATNVLQNVPSVSVDQNGQVSLRGTGNVTIYIDGKPSGAAGGGRAVNLDQIPASQIESVEVMTNPSARYDAEGAGGIINIVLKKQKQDGFNGSVAANVGTGDKYTGSLGLNRRQGRVNVFGNYDFRFDQRWGRNDSRQLNQVEGEQIVTEQVSRNGQRSQTHTLRAGLDWNISPQHTLTVTAQPNLNTNSLPDALTTDIRRGSTLRRFGADNGIRSEFGSADFSADYRRTWDGQKRRELTANVVYSPVRGEQVLSQNQNVGLPDELVQRQVIDFQLTQSSTQLDYTHPFGEKARLDAGLKTTFRRSGGSYDFERAASGTAVYARIDSLSNNYRFDEYVQAGYATYQGEAGKLSYQGGLRTEHTTMRGLLRTTGLGFARRYLNLFPSATLAYQLSADQRLQLSFARRLNRPDAPLLLPFTNYSDPRNYRVGNTRLRPEYINALELGHQQSWGAATLSTTAFFRQTTGQIQRYRSVDTTLTRLNADGLVITRTSFVNVGQNSAYGLELSFNQPLTKWWRLNVNGSGFRNVVASTIGSTRFNRNYAYTARLNTTFTPLKKLDVQLTANYRSPNVTSQGRIDELYFVDLALKKDVLNDRGSLTLRVSDVFDTNRLRAQAYGEDLALDFRFKRESRVALLGFIYRFGNDQAPARPRRRGEQAPANGAPGADF